VTRRSSSDCGGEGERAHIGDGLRGRPRPPPSPRNTPRPRRPAPLKSVPPSRKESRRRSPSPPYSPPSPPPPPGRRDQRSPASRRPPRPCGPPAPRSAPRHSRPPCARPSRSMGDRDRRRRGLASRARSRSRPRSPVRSPPSSPSRRRTSVSKLSQRPPCRSRELRGGGDGGRCRRPSPPACIAKCVARTDGGVGRGRFAPARTFSYSICKCALERCVMLESSSPAQIHESWRRHGDMLLAEHVLATGDVRCPQCRAVTWPAAFPSCSTALALELFLRARRTRPDPLDRGCASASCPARTTVAMEFTVSRGLRLAPLPETVVRLTDSPDAGHDFAG
jgi:hypothetical protein